jgi:hypothetical protein
MEQTAVMTNDHARAGTATGHDALAAVATVAAITSDDAVAAMTAMATVASHGLILTANQGDSNNREKDRDSQQHNSIHDETSTNQRVPVSDKSHSRRIRTKHQTGLPGSDTSLERPA